MTNYLVMSVVILLILLKKLDYKDREEDHSDDLEILYMMVVEEYPDAKKMKPGKQ